MFAELFLVPRKSLHAFFQEPHNQDPRKDEEEGRKEEEEEKEEEEDLQIFLQKKISQGYS